MRSTDVRFIAEIGSNHNGDLDLALRMIDEAFVAGFWGVKFQLFRVESLFAPEALAANPVLSDRRRVEVPLTWLAPLVERARERNLKFGATPCYEAAVDALREAGADYLKISSYDLLRKSLIRACVESGLPLIMSTGMATMAEAYEAFACARDAGCTSITLLHCVSEYPAPEPNLSPIENMRSAFGVPVGWSDHTVSEDVITRAVYRWGASVVEMHVDFDVVGADERPGFESAGGHVWAYSAAADVIARLSRGVRQDQPIAKTFTPGEENERNWRADPDDGLRPMRSIRGGLR